MTPALVAPAVSAPESGPRFYTNDFRYAEGGTIAIKLRHDNHYKVATHAETWDITNLDTGELVAQYYWPEDERQMAPHQYKTWVWDQRHACYGACQNVWAGDPARPGRYEVATTVDGERVSREFSIGQYFHVAFEGRPNADFVLYSNEAETVEQLRAELDRPQEERQIVAGVVRQRKPFYNPNWSYVFGERTIFLGEVFVEVCDASPYYVERHLRDWRGQQWCPWSSFIASEGL